MKRVAAIVLWLLLGVGALLLSATIHLSTQRARDVGRDALIAYVDGQMRGSLRIGRFETLTPWGGDAVDVDLIDPDGRVVLHAERVHVALDLAQLADGRLRFSHGRVAEGEVVLYPDEEGIPSFIHVFEAAEPSDEPPSPDGIVAIVDDLHVENMVVRGDVLGLEGIRVEDLQAHGRLLIDSREQHPLDIRIWSGSGRLVAPFPYEADLERIVGRVRDDPHQGTELYVRASTDRDRARANLSYRIPEGGTEEELDLRIEADPVHVETVAASGFDWAETFTGPARGRVRLHGPPDDLVLHADLSTEGGPVTIEGRVPSEGETSVQVSSEGLRIDRVIPGAPELEVQGTFDLETAGEQTEVVVALDPFEYQGVRVPGARVRGSFDEDRFVVHDARAPLEGGGELRASGEVGYDGEIEIRVDGNVANIGREPNLREWVPGARGGLRMGADVRVGADGRLDVRGRWVLTNVAYGPARAARLVAVGSLGGTTDAPTARLNLEGTGVAVYDVPLGNGTGFVGGGPRRFDVTTDLRHPRREVALRARGELLEGGIRADVDALDVRAQGERWQGRVSGLLVAGSTIELASFDLRNGSQHVTGSGRWQQRRGREDVFHVVADEVQLGSLWVFLDEPPELDARVTGTADIGGDLEAQPTVDVDLTFADGHVLDVAGLDGSLLARYRTGTLEADAGFTVQGGGELDITLRGALDQDIRLRDAYRDGAYESTVRLRDVDLRLLRALRIDELPALEGRAAGTVVLSGALDVFDFSGRLDVPALRIESFPAIGLETTFGFEDGAVVARAITRDETGDLVEAEGSMLIDLVGALEDPSLILPMLQMAPWRLALRMPPRELGTLPAPIAERIPAADVLRGSATLSIRGGAYRPHADLQANVEYAGELRDAPCATDAIPRASLRAELRNDETRADLVGFLGSARVLQAEARAPTPLDAWLSDPESFAPPPTDVEAYVINAPIEEIPSACQYGAGAITATLEIDELFGEATSATFQAFSDGLQAHRLEVRGRGDRRQVRTRERTPPSRFRFKAETGNGVTTTDGRFEWWNGGETRFGGDLPTLWGGENGLPAVPEDAEIYGFADLYDMPVRAGLAWLDAIGNVEGSLFGNVIAEGALTEPRLSGELELVDGRLEVPSVGQRLEDVVGTFLFEDDRITFQNLRVRDGEGIALVAGDITLEGFGLDRASLRLESSRFPIRQEGSVLAELDGNAQIDARFLDRAIEGDVVVERLHVRLAEDLGRTPQDLATHPDILVLGEEAAAPLSDPYRIALHVDATRPFAVKHDDFAAQVTADLDVLYADPRFEVTGGVELGDGHFDVFGKRFDVERGAMIFDAEQGLDPEVNLVAVHDLRSNETVTVTASGRLSDPQIRFSSTVTDDRAEIIALLVSGDVRRQTNAEAERAPTDFLVGIAAGVLTLSLREQFGAAIPSIIFESNQYGGAQIRGGWRFDENLPERLRRVIRGIYVEGYFNTTGEDGGEQRTLGQVQDYGFLLELAFPRNIVNTNTFTPPNNFSLDVTWQP